MITSAYQIPKLGKKLELTSEIYVKCLPSQLKKIQKIGQYRWRICH